MTTVCNYEVNEDNFLEVIVLRYSDGYYLEDQDMFNLSGIFRNVSIYSLPQPVYIQDFSYQTKVDHCSQSAVVDIEVKFSWNFADILNADTLSYTSQTSSPYSSSILGIQEHNLQSYALYLKNYFVLNAKVYEEGVMQQSIPPAASAADSDSSNHMFVFSNSSTAPVCKMSQYVPVPPVDEWTSSVAERSASPLMSWDYASDGGAETTLRMSMTVPYVTLWTVRLLAHAHRQLY